MSQPFETFSCPQCGQRFNWAASLAGRKLGCACGNVLTVPEAEAPELVPLAGEDDEPPPGKLELDAQGREVAAPVTPAAPARVLNYQSPRASKGSVSEEVRARQWYASRERWVPLSLLGCGALAIGASMVLGPSPRFGPSLAWQITLTLPWDIGITFLLAPVLLLLIDANIESVPAASLKLLSAIVARFAIWAMFAAALGVDIGGFIGFVLSTIAFGVVLSFLFELDLGDASIAVVALTALRWLSYFGLFALM